MKTPRIGSGEAGLGAGARRRQRGATAVEFAFVFPLLFVVTYAAIVYGYVYMAAQTVAYAAQAGAEAAVQVPYSNDTGSYQTAVKNAVLQRVSTLTSFLISPGNVQVPDPQFTDNSVRVTVTYTGVSGLFPTLTLPPFFNTPIPPLPVELTSYGVVTLAAF